MTSLAPRTGDAAAEHALDRRGRDLVPAGICQIFTRGSFGTPASGTSAILAFQNAARSGLVVKTSKPREFPRGVAAYFRGGEFGHAVTTLGSGRCVSTDWPRRGDVSVAKLADIADRWNKQLIGYVLIDANGFVLRKQPAVHLAVMQHEARSGGTRERAGVRRIQFALNDRYGHTFAGNGLFGPQTRKAYKHHQKKIGSDPRFCDGIPGAKDLRSLGKGRFSVVA